MEEFADAAYALHQSLQLLKDTSVTLNRHCEMYQRMAGLIWITIDSPEPIRTDYVTASPRVKYVASPPSRKKNPEKYLELMNWLKIPQEAFIPKHEDESPAIELHWVGFCDLLSNLAAEGKPLPAGVDVDKVYPQYKLTLHGKIGVDEQVQ